MLQETIHNLKNVVREKEVKIQNLIENSSEFRWRTIGIVQFVLWICVVVLLVSIMQEKEEPVY
jgi:hypothetical protein